MARQRSEDKRNALMAAATRVIVTQGLGAPTAVIAQEAGVANGSLFTYFETKAALFNQLYLELKTGMAAAALKNFPEKADRREQLFRVWSNWMGWAVASPDKRKALSLLAVADEITPETREEGHKAMAIVGGIINKSRENGSLSDVPIGFVIAIMNSLADATMDYMVQDSANAEEHCKVGFDALWRVLS